MNEQLNQKDFKLEWKKLFLNYQWIVKNMPFFIFLSMLAVLYIYNGHHAEKKIKDINKTARELEELQYEYKTIRSELMFQSKQSEIVKAVEPLGLKELIQPPMKIGDSTEMKNLNN
jgi:cell division protein FtsL